MSDGPSYGSASYGSASYGDAFADVYDDWYGDSPTVASSDLNTTVQFLCDLANGGPVLELGVGTGRIALPLAAAGISVVGVDASDAMLAKLAAKPDGKQVTTVCADMAGELPTGPFQLVFIAINTFFNLTSRNQQVACMRNVAERLTDEGSFVIEAFVPDLERYGSGLSLRTVDLGGAVLSASSTDRERQVITGQYIELQDGHLPRLRPWQICFQTPDQIDEMAGQAGFSRTARWANWAKEPFTDESSHHVSVFQRRRRIR